MRAAFINLLPLAAAAIALGGNMLAKTWVANQRALFFVAAMAAYIAGAVLWLLFLREIKTLSTAVPWWQAMMFLPSFIAGVWYFQEKLSFFEIAAAAMILAGTLLLNFGRTA